MKKITDYDVIVVRSNTYIDDALQKLEAYPGFLIGGQTAILKSYALTSSEVFEKRDFLLVHKNIVKWKIRSQSLFWHVTRTLLKRKDLNQKPISFPKISNLDEDVVSKLK